MDLSVEGNVFLNGSFQHCCIGVDEGKIVKVKKILKGDKHFDFGNQLVLPAGVDMHVHFRDPGFTYKEDFSTGSKAALYGGISCVFDMPNTKPQTDNITTLKEKINIANRKSYVDFGVYAGVNNNNKDKLGRLATSCNGFKVFMGSSTNASKLDTENLSIVFQQADSLNRCVLVHAEDNNCLKQHKIKEENLSHHLKSRPSICEKQAITHVLESVKDANCKVHICHISSSEGLELLKERPKGLTVGVTPHHSLLSIDKSLPPQSFLKANPPVRTDSDKNFLFNAVKRRAVDIIESDHAPHTLKEKNQDFESAPSGIPGVETMMPMFLYQAKQQNISFGTVISLLCDRPARIIGVPKGKIELGFDADFTIVDYKNICKIKSERLHSRSGWTPFEGWPAIFPKSVFIRGEKLIQDNELQVNPGFGSFIGA